MMNKRSNKSMINLLLFSTFLILKPHAFIKTTTPFTKRTCSSFSSLKSSTSSNTFSSSLSNIFQDLSVDISQATKILSKNLLSPKINGNPEELVNTITSLSNEIEMEEVKESINSAYFTLKAMEYSRYSLLSQLLQIDYQTYKTTATFLSNRISRLDFPNVQDIPFPTLNYSSIAELQKQEEDLVPDCTLPNMTFSENLLDVVLLKIFRSLVIKNSQGIAKSDKPGIEGLLEQARVYMLSGATEQEQKKMVQSTLRDLMGPIVPIYRLFMSGIIPQRIVNYFNDGADITMSKQKEELQIGPLFYAPFFTSIVTPVFFSFLVGPSYVNRRQDGNLGGLVVEKCKFLQQSNCKNICLHQCKLPAQGFFKEELGMDLTVIPNFETQECQWSFGEVAKDVEDDPSFPTGCISGCPSRKMMKEEGSKIVSNCR